MGSVKIGVGFALSRAGLASASEIGAFAETVEDLGLDSIWASDHLVSRQPSLDTTALLAFMAARTRRIKLGPSVLILPPRDPIQVAKAYATLDHLTGGRRRVILGVGLGGDPRDSEACGVPVRGGAGAGRDARRSHDLRNARRGGGAGPGLRRCGLPEVHPVPDRAGW